MMSANNILQTSVQARGAVGRDHLAKLSRVRILTGDVAASATPVILHTLLGSCVAVCLHDPLLRIGGMNHILLPGGRGHCLGARFGVHAMELLINQLMNLGVDRARLVAKAFGGAAVLPGMKRTSIGNDNAKFVHDFLSTERIPLLAERLGGSHAVHVCFDTHSGKVRLRSADGSRLQKIIRVEDIYRRTHFAEKYFSGEITLF